MAVDSSNVRVAVTGAVAIAKSGTKLPTDADSPLGKEYRDLGYVSEDGITESRERSTEKIKAWQHADTVREVITESSASLQFTLIETRLEVVQLYYGAKVADDGSILIVPSASGGRHVVVVDVIDGSDLIRAIAPAGEVTEVGEQTYAGGEPIGYEVTIACNVATIGKEKFALKKYYSALKKADGDNDGDKTIPDQGSDHGDSNGSGLEPAGLAVPSQRSAPSIEARLSTRSL